MGIKKIRKGEGNLTSLIFTILIVIGVFTGMFLYLAQKANENSIILDSKFNNTYNNLISSQNIMQNNSEQMQGYLKNMTEADNTYQVAINGLKGLGTVFKSMLLFLETTSNTKDALVETYQSTFPSWIIALITVGIILFVVLLFISIYKGDPNKV